MARKKLPRSIRKYIRREKARIRREVFDLEEQKKLINQLYQKFYPSNKSALDQRQKSPKATNKDQRGSVVCEKPTQSSNRNQS